MAEENVPPKLLPEQQAILDIVDELRLDIAVQRFLLRTLIGQRIGEGAGVRRHRTRRCG
jgi:hypothetical protein